MGQETSNGEGTTNERLSELQILSGVVPGRFSHTSWMIFPRIFDRTGRSRALDAVLSRKSAAAAVPSSAQFATLFLRPPVSKRFLLDRRAGHDGSVDFVEGSDRCRDHDCRLSRYGRGCAVAVDLVSRFLMPSPTAAFEFNMNWMSHAHAAHNRRTTREQSVTS